MPQDQQRGEGCECHASERPDQGRWGEWLMRHEGAHPSDQGRRRQGDEQRLPQEPPQGKAGLAVSDAGQSLSPAPAEDHGGEQRGLGARIGDEQRGGGRQGRARQGVQESAWQQRPNGLRGDQCCGGERPERQVGVQRLGTGKNIGKAILLPRQVVVQAVRLESRRDLLWLGG